MTSFIQMRDVCERQLGIRVATDDRFLVQLIGKKVCGGCTFHGLWKVCQ